MTKIFSPSKPKVIAPPPPPSIDDLQDETRKEIVKDVRRRRTRGGRGAQGTILGSTTKSLLGE